MLNRREIKLVQTKNINRITFRSLKQGYDLLIYGVYLYHKSFYIAAHRC